MLSESAPPAPPVLSARGIAMELGRTIASGAVAGALGGLLVGGVLGRLAMRLLAATSPSTAQGRITDDNAVVGRITLDGSLDLTLFTTLAGVIGGLIYIWVRRVLPESRRERVLGFGILTGTLGGAFFVHDHPSFDYTVLTPTWLAVAMFVALPFLFGLVSATLAESLDGPTGWLRRAPTLLVLGLGALLTLPTVLFTGIVILASFVVALLPRLRAFWRGRAVTIAGSILYLLVVLWGLYGLVVDIVSISTDTPSTAPFNP